jgi:hypothetical protein
VLDGIYHDGDYITMRIFSAVESDNNASMGPAVTAKFSYTILPR